MSLPRKDVRAKLDHDVHEALVAICAAKGVDIGEFVEALIVPEVTRLVHEASVIERAARCLTLSGNRRESPEKGNG